MKKVAYVIVENSKGELFVNQRSPKKEIFPNLYSLGAGGHIEEGETPEQAAHRELFEELGIKSKLSFVFEFHFQLSKDVKEIAHVYHTTFDGEINSDCDEFQWTGWMSKEEVDKIVADGKMCPDTQVGYEKWKSLL